ncbi:MAG: response regulator, partial [Spirochaetes bacterium]|nr:response regulator [Spirochaetota bacterium]
MKSRLEDKKIKKRSILPQVKFFDAILEALTHPVYIADAVNRKIVVANKYAMEYGIVPGVKYDEIKVESFDFKLLKESPLDQMIKTGFPVHMELVLVDKSGKNVFRELNGYPILDSEGNVAQTIEFITDITERIKSQEELVKLSQAVEQSLNIVMITDRNSIIEYVNPKFSDTTGYSFEEVVGKKASFMGTATREQKKDFLEKLISNGEWRGEFYNRTKGGEYYWEYATIYAIKNTLGEVTHYIKDGVNISKRKAAEAELQAAKEKAEKASMFKSEFLANMSHEIRTPLNSILGFIELLSETELDKKQKDYFDTIKDSSKVLLGIIDDILDFSKIENGRLEIDNAKFYLKHELEPVVDLFTARADEKNIEFLYFIDPSLPEFVFGDPLRIKQVLNNLISNACKFTPEGGKILVEIRLLELSEEVCRVSFSVEDTGIGIPEKKQEEIFKAFFQADSAITRKYGGTGLGLAISLQLVRLMGSELHLKSRENEGSKFYFELTFTQFSGIDISRKDYNFQNLRCLLHIKDPDDMLQLNNIRRYLIAFNIEVELFRASKDLENIDDSNKNIIFIDHLSLRKDDILKFLDSLPDVPVIMIASRMDRDLVSSLSNKIDKVIFKPVYASKIIGAIIEILHNDKKNNREAGVENIKRISFSANALVAEDNIINQKLITLMLKEVGVNADIADNGEAAVKKFRKGSYDVIFMDVNMPVMDGIEATKKILKIEAARQLKHTPIIALTAKSIIGDKEILLNSGMDDYLSKPVSLGKLYNILYLHLMESGKDLLNREETEKNEKVESLKYDIENSALHLGVSADFLNDLIIQFSARFDGYLADLSSAVEVRDFEAIRSEAHKIKGAALNLRFDKLADYFFEIETNAKNCNIINYDLLLDKAKSEFNDLKKYLDI